MDEEHARVPGFATGEVEIVATSGTSEDRVSVVWHQPWWDRSEREAARIHPVLARIFDAPHREAVLTSPLCAGNLCHVGEASMAERTLGNLLFLNQSPDPGTWNGATARRMVDELAAFRPDIIEADPAYLARFGRLCRDAGMRPPVPACIVLTYEYPSRLHLRDIARAFPGVPVVSSYGSTETGHVFTQCAAGRFHENTATCRVDLQPLGGGADPAVGRILVTTLDNPWFTLLRFDTGDLGRLSPGPCPCGRGDGIVLSAIEGRERDVTRAADGRPVTVRRLDESLADFAALDGYQVEQVGPCAYVAHVCLEGGDVHETERGIAAALAALYGAEASIEVRPEAAIAPEQSGKFRLARAAALPRVEERSA